MEWIILIVGILIWLAGLYFIVYPAWYRKELIRRDRSNRIKVVKFFNID